MVRTAINNMYIHLKCTLHKYLLIGLFDLKMKYDESDNLFIRATRTVTDKVGDIFRKYFNLMLTIEICMVNIIYAKTCIIVL